MTVILTNDIIGVFTDIMATLLKTLPAFAAIWMVFYFIRELLFKE